MTRPDGYYRWTCGTCGQVTSFYRDPAELERLEVDTHSEVCVGARNRTTGKPTRPLLRGLRWPKELPT